MFRTKDCRVHLRGQVVLVALGTAKLLGCATGSVTLGQPRIYRDNRVTESTDRQLRLIEKDAPDLTGIQGYRARASSASLEVRGATTVKADLGA